MLAPWASKNCLIAGVCLVVVPFTDGNKSITERLCAPNKVSRGVMELDSNSFSAVYNSSKKFYLQFQPNGLLTNYSVKVC